MAVPPPSSPQSPALDKKVLRARMRADRDAFVMAGVDGILPPQALLDRLEPGKVVSSYVPLGSEADPAMLAWAARQAGCRIALPFVVSRADPLRFLLWDQNAPLVAGPMGLQQCDSACEEVAPDIILTPLVAFDADLNRLGQGAGHYDRAFAAHPQAWRLGVAWSIQQLPSLPFEPWDMPLDAIVTERAFLVKPRHEP